MSEKRWWHRVAGFFQEIDKRQEAGEVIAPEQAPVIAEQVLAPTEERHADPFAGYPQDGATTTLESPTPEYMRLWGLHSTIPGITVTPDTAMNFAIVFAIVKIIAESIAMLPLVLYEYTETGKAKAFDHPLYFILAKQWNDEQTKMEALEMLIGHLALRGNAYAQIVSTGDGVIVEIIPWHPDRVTVERLPGGRLLYHYTKPGGRREPYQPEEVLHVKLLSQDGIYGLSPINQLRNSLELALAQEKSSAKFYGNGVRASGVLEHPKEMSDKAYNRLKEGFLQDYAGIDNAHKPIILEEDAKWKQITLSPVDAELLASRKFQLAELARPYRIPLHKLQELDRATFSNIEHQSIEYFTDCLAPWMVRLELAFEKALLTRSERKKYFIKFNHRALLRGDQKSVNEAYAIARQNGWMNANEIRELEDMDRIPGEEGDAYMSQMNLAIGGGSQMSSKQQKRELYYVLAEPQNPITASNVLAIAQRQGIDAQVAYKAIVDDQIARLIRREKNSLQKRKEDERDLQDFYAELRSVFVDYVKPTATALGLEDMAVLELRASAYCAQRLSEAKKALAENRSLKEFADGLDFDEKLTPIILGELQNARCA